MTAKWVQEKIREGLILLSLMLVAALIDWMWTIILERSIGQ